MSQSIPYKMRAVVIGGITAGADVRLSTVDAPQVVPGRVLIRVRGFGLNHSEQMLRQGEVLEPYIKKPCVPGIECVGEIADAGDADFEAGQPVVALMGGMGRSFWGGYAEYALVPADHVFALPQALSERFSWTELAAIPETYHTAWGSLTEGLQLQADDTLLVRGATSALGYAAVQLARAVGARVIATTHREERLGEVREMLGLPVEEAEPVNMDERWEPVMDAFAGSSEFLASHENAAVLDTGELVGKLDDYHITKALEVVGPRTLLDTLRCVERHGIVCNTGVLGGVEEFHDFDPIKGLVSGVYLTSFYSNRPTDRGMAELFDFIAEHDLRPQIAAAFDFDHIADALALQDAGGMHGKIVVTM